MEGRLRNRIGLGVLAVCGMITDGVSGQEVAQPPRPRATASRIEAAPIVDGEVLGDPAWRGVGAATGFVQNTPDEGEPASQRTEVYIAYTENTLYFGVVCRDSDPEGIIVADSRRDSSLTETDSFQIILDTYRDQQTGFVFGTNPVGIQYDGQVTREGEGSMMSAGGFNGNWDGVWEVQARISEIGWSAEFAIPFRTLRYPRGEHQTWSMNLQRNIRRRNENAFWSPVPRQFNLYRLAMAGSLTGLAVPSQRNLKLTPYVLAEAQRPGLEGADWESDNEIGIDLKYSITPSLTLDATVNTDFAQVEVDELQINLNRFNLFFPEKRPFFLENAGYFSVGVPQEVELFFSRRIGIGPHGEIIPIVGGLRVSGKAAERYNLGALVMRTEQVDGVAPRNDFAVARLSRDFPNRSYIGGIVVSREGGGSQADADDSNLTYSLDGRWGIGENGLIQGFVAQTDTPGAEGDEYAFRVGGSYASQRWSFSGNYTEVAEDFNPEVGFLTRDDYRKFDAAVLRRIRPKDLGGIHELRPHVSYRGFWDFDGFQETGYLHVDNHTEWKNGYEIHTGVNFTREGLTEPFQIYPGIIVPPGTYDHEEAVLTLITNRGAPISFALQTIIGGFFGGDRLKVTPTLRFRINETLTSELKWISNDIELPGGAFTTNLGRLRLSYSFTPRIYLQALIQYNDVDSLWASNLRFTWLRTASTGLHVVYNEINDIGGAGTGIADRSVTVKYSHLFDLLR